jgi:hypothetical protein
MVFSSWTDSYCLPFIIGKQQKGKEQVSLSKAFQ